MTKGADFSLKDCAWPRVLLSSADISGAYTVGRSLDSCGPARSMPIGELYHLADGPWFRVAEPGEDPHACYPGATSQYPNGIPLIAVRWTDLTADDYRQLVAALPARQQAEPKYHWEKRAPS